MNKMNDLINRQDAINALGEEPDVYSGKDEYAQGLNNQWHYDVNAIKAVPSVQSEPPTEIQEILNYLDTTLHPIVSPEHWDVYSELHDMISALPSVQPEPKTGKWIKVYGFATPGGDPVWRCSECGKGLHVYGIEASTYGADIAEHQWVSCPNCGADMRGEQDG